MEGIELFVNILVFAKILSQWRRKEEGQEFRSLEVRRKLIALKNQLRLISRSCEVIALSKSNIGIR